MLQWCHVLHFYQPPTQDLALTETILQSCYLPLLKILERHPKAKFTINVSASLLEQLERIPEHNFFVRLTTLAKRGQIEILQSPIFHALLPLTPEIVARRQINKNTSAVQRLCGITPIDGLFPPELAIDSELISHFSDYKFILIDESSVDDGLSLERIWQQSRIVLPTSLQLVVVSRTISEIIRSVPHAIAATKLLNFIAEHTGANALTANNVIVSLSDAEIFGHHYEHRLELLEQLITSPLCQFMKLTEALSIIDSVPITQQSIAASTWQTTSTDLQQSNPFPLWNNPSNHLHRQYQQLANLAIASFDEPTAQLISPATRALAEDYLDRGLSSCHTFWLSNHPWWHPDIAAAGALYLIKTIRTLPLSHDYKKGAEELYHSFSLQLWHYHWSDTVNQGYARFDDQRTQLLKNLPLL